MRPMACESEESMLIAPRSWSTSSAAIVSARMRDSAKARASGIFGVKGGAPLHRIHGERHGRVRRGRQAVRLAADADDVGRVAAAGAFGVVRVNRPPLEGANRVLDKARLLPRVGMVRG